MKINMRAKCENCGKKFFRPSGSGFYYSIFKCVDCGKPKRIDHQGKRSYEINLTEKQIGKCTDCGGGLSDTAKDRCPKCKSENITPDTSPMPRMCAF